MTVGEGHQGDLVLVNPLSKLGDVLRDDIGFRGIANNVAGHQQCALGIHHGDRSGLLPDGVYEQDPMSSDRTLEHHRLEVVDSRLDEGLIGILF